MISEAELIFRCEQRGEDPAPMLQKRKVAVEHQRRYYEVHVLCPRCRTRVTTRAIDPPPIDLENPLAYKDDSYCICSGCDWSGTVDELLAVYKGMPKPKKLVDFAKLGDFAPEVQEAPLIPKLKKMVNYWAVPVPKYDSKNWSSSTTHVATFYTGN